MPRMEFQSVLGTLRSGRAYQLMNGAGHNIGRGVANFGLACTAAQSEYLALLIGCLRWAQELALRQTSQDEPRPTTLWAFLDNRLVVGLVAKSVGGHPRSRGVTDDLATWKHLAPLHEISESIFRELRGMKCAISVQWLSRDSTYISNVDREARKIACPRGSRRARKTDQSLWEAYCRAFSVLDEADADQKNIYWNA